MHKVEPPSAPSTLNAEGRSIAERALELALPFRRAQRATRDALRDASSVTSHAGGTCLFQQGAQADALYLLARGDVRMDRSARKRSFPASYRSPGELLGEAGLTADRKHAESAHAMGPCVVVRLPLPLVEEKLGGDGGLSLGVLELLRQRRLELEGRVESMLFRGVEARLAEFLLDASRRWGKASERGRRIDAPMTHLEIAQAIGSTRETVTLTLGLLRRAGALDVSGRQLVVRDAEDLEARVAGTRRLETERRRRARLRAAATAPADA